MAEMIPRSGDHFLLSPDGPFTGRPLNPTQGRPDLNMYNHRIDVLKDVKGKFYVVRGLSEITHVSPTRADPPGRDYRTQVRPTDRSPIDRAHDMAFLPANLFISRASSRFNAARFLEQFAIAGFDVVGVWTRGGP